MTVRDFYQGVQERFIAWLNQAMGKVCNKTYIDKTKEFWSEYLQSDVSDEQAAIIHSNTLAFVEQVLKMKSLLENAEKNTKEEEAYDK